MTAKPHLDRDHAHHLLGQMLRIRLFEERCAELYTQQKIRGFIKLQQREKSLQLGRELAEKMLQVARTDTERAERAAQASKDLQR